MVVSFDELQHLGGERSAAKVIDWLKAIEVPFLIGADGKPRTTRDLLYNWHPARTE